MELLKERSFLRFFTAQGLSSFGDWIGMIAILALVKRITNDEFAVAAMLLARLAPALVIGPVGGVIVDRFNRKKVMVFCDLGRGALILALPFIETIARALPPARPVILLFIVSAALEMFTLLWQSAKDAILPNMLQRRQLQTHANSLMLFAAYGTFPLSGAAFGLLVPLGEWLGKNFEFFKELGGNEENLAFFFDSFTFLVSAAITSTLLIAPHIVSRQPLKLGRAWADFVAGLKVIIPHRQIRLWILGIGMIFAGVGAFLSIAVFYVTDVLGAGSAGFGLMVTAVGVGLGTGFIFAGLAAQLRISKDILFSVSVFGLGGALIGFASASTLATGATLGVILGLFAGLAYPLGLTLMQESAEDQYRGRIVASMHSVVRLALVGALALSPIIARVIGDSRWVLFGQEIDLRGIRVVMWLGGLSIVIAGVLSTGAVFARLKEAVIGHPGLFLVFEGGEGTGKSTQMDRLASFLTSQGYKVVVTREPGGTLIGERLRDVLLDSESTEMSAKAEALLYAADRAQHVEEVIRPALKAGHIVISDRYLDSSLAYQGLARGLGIEEVLDLNAWSTGGLMPDLVFLLRLEPRRGLERSGETDRIEREGIAFHVRVMQAYEMLVRRYPDRFVAIEGDRPADQIEDEIRHFVIPMLQRNKHVAPAA